MDPLETQKIANVAPINETPDITDFRGVDEKLWSVNFTSSKESLDVASYCAGGQNENPLEDFTTDHVKRDVWKSNFELNTIPAVSQTSENKIPMAESTPKKIDESAPKEVADPAPKEEADPTPKEEADPTPKEEADPTPKEVNEDMVVETTSKETQRIVTFDLNANQDIVADTYYTLDKNNQKEVVGNLVIYYEKEDLSYSEKMPILKRYFRKLYEYLIRYALFKKIMEMCLFLESVPDIVTDVIAELELFRGISGDYILQLPREISRWVVEFFGLQWILDIISNVWYEVKKGIQDPLRCLMRVHENIIPPVEGVGEVFKVEKLMKTTSFEWMCFYLNVNFIYRTCYGILRSLKSTYFTKVLKRFYHSLPEVVNEEGNTADHSCMNGHYCIYCGSLIPLHSLTCQHKPGDSLVSCQET